MFRTVKSKIIITAIIMLAFLMFAFMCHTMISRMKTKQLMVQNYGYSVNTFVDAIKAKIIKTEDNLRGLALIGGLYYQTDRSNELTDRVIYRIFENYPETLGGGIWFKPYIVDKSVKYNCFYAYRDKNNKVVVDKDFASEEYDYPNQGWYKQIMSKVTPERNIVWSKPYFENMGSYSLMVTAGTGIYVEGELVGIVTVDWEINSLIDDIAKMKPIEKTFSMYKSGDLIHNSFALLGNVDYDYVIAVTDPYLDGDKLVGHSLKEIPWYKDNLYAITYITYHGKKYVPFARRMSNGMELVICIPKLEMFKDVNKFYMYIVLAMLLIGFIIPAILYFSLNRNIIKPIDKLIEIANEISRGEDVKIKIEKPEEFAKLAATYDSMTNNIKSITKEREKINSELSIAKSIQESSLPNVFPPFPDNSDFDIFASMEPAKEVGGDFFDFYFTDDTHFMFLIADVSGKGVPAALFMMTVKTLINNISQMGYSPNQLFEIINKKICETNKQGFFVTLLAGICDVKTGNTSLVNCGHNQPLIKRNNGQYEYLNLNPNIVLGAFENSKFDICETKLNAGDIIFTYTDGITEAINEEGELYGEKRLADSLNRQVNISDIKEITNNIKNDIKDFTKSTPQSDDITMLVFKYSAENTGSKNNTKIFKQPADLKNYKSFYTWLHETAEEWNLNDEISNKIDMCAEEIFANITFYAYGGESGYIETRITKIDDEIVLQFEDKGVAYNPLEKPDPDINLPPEERPLGGLGIFMVKQMADIVNYERAEDRNVLRIVFKINS